MKYKVEFLTSAAKEFRKLPQGMQERVLTILKILQVDQFSEVLNIRKIRGRRDLYRVRIGDYRLVYSVEPSSVILVVRVRHRKDGYNLM